MLDGTVPSMALYPTHLCTWHPRNIRQVCYRAVLEHNRGLLQRGAALVHGGGGVGGRSPLLAGSFANVSMMLRHCCNHPWLIKEVEEGALANLQVRRPVGPHRRRCPARSLHHPS